MKIKIEFEINVDLKEVEKQYSDEEVKYFLNITEDEHIQKMTKFLKEEFEDDCTDVKVNSLIITKNKKEREIENECRNNE